MQDSDNGYIQIPRAHPIWSFPPNTFRLAMELIRRATHKDITFRHHGREIELKRGQLFISERQLSRDCGFHRTALRRTLSRLECVRFCVRFCVQSGFILTICDYNYFNSSKFPLVSASAPTYMSKVVHQTYHSGTPDVPPLYNEQGTLKNQDTVSSNKEKDFKEPSGKKPLTEENFDRSEIKGLRVLFGSDDAIASHLRTRGFIESAIQKILKLFKQEAYA